MKNQIGLFLSATFFTASCFASYLGEVSKLLVKSANGARISMSPVTQDPPEALDSLTASAKGALKGFTYIGATNDGRLVFVKAEQKGRQVVATLIGADELETDEENGPAVVKVLVLRSLSKNERSAIAYRNSLPPQDPLKDAESYFKSRQASPLSVINESFLQEISAILFSSLGESLYQKDIASLYTIQQVYTVNGLAYVKLGFQIETARINAEVVERILTSLMRSRGK